MAFHELAPMYLLALPAPVPSPYLLALTVIGFVSMSVALVLPAWRRPASVLAVALMAGNAFAPDLALGLRVLAAALTPVLAVACVLRLRRR